MGSTHRLKVKLRTPLTIGDRATMLWFLENNCATLEELFAVRLKLDRWVPAGGGPPDDDHPGADRYLASVFRSVRF